VSFDAHITNLKTGETRIYHSEKTWTPDDVYDFRCNCGQERKFAEAAGEPVPETGNCWCLGCLSFSVRVVDAAGAVLYTQKPRP
jgi:hypothetical protein